eukprot:scaffold18529_cov62-Phaeocystis_antarctica.AAC.8
MPTRMHTPTRMPATSPAPRSPSPKSSSQCGGGGGGPSGEGMAGGSKMKGGGAGGPLIERERTRAAQNCAILAPDADPRTMTHGESAVTKGECSDQTALSYPQVS